MDNTSTPIKGAIFDWAGVFCSPGEPFSHPKLTDLTGLSVDELGKATEELQGQYYRGHISSEVFWGDVLKKFHLTLSPQELSAAYLSSYQLYPEMLTLAQKIRAKMPTALLSNLTSEMMHDIVRKHLVDRYFDYLLFSNEIGCMKPEHEAYHLALKKLGTPPQATIFIDDSARNVAAAKALGLHTILFTSPAQCKKELSALVDFAV